MRPKTGPSPIAKQPPRGQESQESSSAPRDVRPGLIVQIQLTEALHQSLLASHTLETAEGALQTIAQSLQKKSVEQALKQTSGFFASCITGLDYAFATISQGTKVFAALLAAAKSKQDKALTEQVQIVSYKALGVSSQFTSKYIVARQTYFEAIKRLNTKELSEKQMLDALKAVFKSAQSAIKPVVEVVQWAQDMAAYFIPPVSTLAQAEYALLLAAQAQDLVYLATHQANHGESKTQDVYASSLSIANALEHAILASRVMPLKPSQALQEAATLASQMLANLHVYSAAGLNELLVPAKGRAPLKWDMHLSEDVRAAIDAIIAAIMGKRPS